MVPLHRHRQHHRLADGRRPSERDLRHAVAPLPGPRVLDAGEPEPGHHGAMEEVVVAGVGLQSGRGEALA
jgi:hypothetical protein